MSIFDLVIMTDYGVMRPSKDVAYLINRAKKRKDGQPDLRFSYGKIAQFCIDAAIERAKAEYLGQGH